MNALLASVSWLAFGVPMRREANQRFVDLWKPGYALESIPGDMVGFLSGEPMFPNAKKL